MKPDKDESPFDLKTARLLLPMPDKSVLALVTPVGGTIRELGSVWLAGDDALDRVDDYLTSNFQTSKSARVFPFTDKLEFGPGLVVILGKTGAGKTVLTKLLNQVDGGRSFSRQTVLEPVDDLADLKSLSSRPALTFEGGMQRCGATVIGGICPILDSGRALVYRSSGATGARGVNMGLFEYITQLNAALLLQQRTMAIVLNPLVEDEHFDAFRTYVISSVQTVVTVNQATVRRDQVQVSGSVVQRPDRQPTNFQLRVATNELERPPSSGGNIAVVPAIVSNNMTRTILSRVIN